MTLIGQPPPTRLRSVTFYLVVVASSEPSSLRSFVFVSYLYRLKLLVHVSNGLLTSKQCQRCADNGFPSREAPHIVQPTLDFVGNLCYRTKGEKAGRQDGHYRILGQFCLSIIREDYEQAIRCTDFLKKRIKLEHCVPRRVRAALATIYYDLALTSGMSWRPAKVFSEMVPLLVWYVCSREVRNPFSASDPVVDVVRCQ
jgi:hypothetical protein